MGLSTFAQTSKKTLNYQAVILDPKAIDIPGASIVGQPLSKGKVCLRFSLLNAQGGLDYEETLQVTTDEYGLVNVAIGAGAQAQAGNSTSIYKSFDSVLWNSSVKSLKVSVSYDGCSSFKQVSSQALNYTPYALYAEAVDYKNVRDAPTKLSQFSNDAGYLIPKDLDPLKSDIQTNSSKIEVANKSIADNKQASDATFLVVNQSITSLDTQVAQNTGSISNINTKITDQQNQISDNRNQITATNNNLNTQIGGLQGQLNTTNSTVNSLSGVAEVVSNKSTAINLGGTNPSDQLYPSQKAAKSYIDIAIYDAVGSGVPDATTLAAGKVKLAGDLGGTAANPTVPALANKENTANKSTNVQADGNDDTKYPSVKAVKDFVDLSVNGKALVADLAGKANLASPTFTGTPLAPTPALADNSTQIATTAFVLSKVNAATVNDASSSAKGIVQLAGDLGGSASSPLVAKIQGNLVSSSTPTSGQVLTYDGTSWGPAATSNAAGTLSGTVGIANGGTGATTKTLAFNALSPMTTSGDIIYGGLSGTGTRLAKGNNFSFLTLDDVGLPTWTNAIRATSGSTWNAAVGFSFIGGDWAKNTGMFSDNPDDGNALLKFRITGNSKFTIDPDKVAVLPATASTSKTTGALTVAGGLGVNGNIYASNLNVSGAITAGTWSGTAIAIANGGTGATNAAAALTNLGAAPINANLNDQTGTTYTLLSSDNGKVVTLENGSAITLTVPAGLAAGFNCMIVQKGAGLVTITPASTVTVTNRSGGTKTGGQNAIVTIISISSNYFITGGDMQ
jgi:uncharacterized coiled-coil protein SlyX